MDEPRDDTQALAGIALLVRLVDTGSISAAARSLGLPKSTVSRRLRAMEAEIGQPLLRRSTRAVSPTDLGRRLYDAAAPAVHAAWEAERAVRETDGRVVGTVTVSATAAYARHVLLPVLCAFMQDHAQVRVDLDVEEHRVDVVARAVDVAVRIGPLEDTALIARRIGTVRRRMVAAPAYVAAHGTPAEPADLAHHNAIVTSGALTRRAFEDGTVVTVPWRMSAGRWSWRRPSPCRASASRFCRTSSWQATSPRVRWSRCCPGTASRRCPSGRCSPRRRAARPRCGRCWTGLPGRGSGGGVPRAQQSRCACMAGRRPVAGSSRP